MNFGDKIDRFVQKPFAVFVIGAVENGTQDFIAQIFLNNNAELAVEIVNLRDRQISAQKQIGYIEISLLAGRKMLWINAGDRGRILPVDAKILARRGIGRQLRDLERQIFFG